MLGLFFREKSVNTIDKKLLKIEIKKTFLEAIKIRQQATLITKPPQLTKEASSLQTHSYIIALQLPEQFTTTIQIHRPTLKKSIDLVQSTKNYMTLKKCKISPLIRRTLRRKAYSSNGVMRHTIKEYTLTQQLMEFELKSS